MTFRPLLVTLAAAAFAVFSTAASAQAPAAAAERSAHQQARIAQGVRSGALTPRETARLERGQARVNRAQARAGADGQVTPAERAHVRHLQNHQSRRIFRQKHDAQTNG